MKTTFSPAVNFGGGFFLIKESDAFSYPQRTAGRILSFLFSTKTYLYIHNCSPSNMSTKGGNPSGESDSTPDAVLSNIRQILMDEGLENAASFMFPAATLQAAEKSFYDVLGEKYPSLVNQNVDSPVINNYYGCNGNIANDNSAIESILVSDLSQQKPSPPADQYLAPQPSEVFDKILLFNSEDGRGRMFQQSGKQKRKRVNKGDLVDMRALLVHCAEAVGGNDLKSAKELLSQIRQHSSPFGDGSQRLAHCFANALAARLVGTGSELYAAKKMSSVHILKACRLFISACPFMRMSNFFVTQTIMDLAKKATRLHIIHFGIQYGSQWPGLIQRLSQRPGGPPVLRITGVDFPQPGFQPAARVEETGRRLATYCDRLNVPFEYNGIAQKWETIQFKDLKILKDEMVVVDCLYLFRYLLDDTVVLSSPRDAVLNLIKSINPHVFIHGIVNGSYNSPYFVSRFREALYYFSAVFDMFEANAGREDEERMVFEQEIYGREVLNAIACEGVKRFERPETYKQWKVRNQRAGLRQLPLNQEMVQKVKAYVKLCYHKDFLVDDDGQWLLQGWKGRILFALSCWKTA